MQVKLQCTIKNIVLLDVDEAENGRGHKV